MDELISTQTVSIETAIIISLISGLAGSIIALLLSLYFGHRTKLYERTKLHIDGLVKLEIRLLDINQDIEDNIYVFNLIVKGHKDHTISIARLITLRIEDNYFADSFSSELNNKLYKFRHSIRGLNNDIRNINKNYDILANGLLTGEIKDEKISEHLAGLLLDKDKLLKGLPELKKECEELLAYVRARYENDRLPLMRYRGWVLQKRLKTITHHDTNKWMKKHDEDTGK